MVLCLHSILHLSLIITLESLKNCLRMSPRSCQHDRLHSADRFSLVLITKDEAIMSFTSAFDNYVLTGSASDIRYLQRVALSLGQSWANVTQGWQAISNGTYQQGPTFDPVKRYMWYASTLFRISQVSGSAVFRSEESLISLWTSSEVPRTTSRD